MKVFAQSAAWNAFSVGLCGVCLVLLLSLMIENPFCTLGLPWLPAIHSGSIVAATESDLRVIVSHHGYARVADGAAVRMSELRAAVASAIERRKPKRIIVEADVRVRFGDLQPLFAAARDARVPVELVSEKTSIAADATPPAGK